MIDTPRLAGISLALLLAGVWAAPAGAISEQEARAIVAAEDRGDKDRERDARRHPAELLVFSGVEPGMKVADLGAGDGYTTELLVRAVGPEGTVYGHNVPFVIEKFVKESWPARLSKDLNQAVVRVDRGLQDPLPEEARDLDLVTMVFVYHDALYRPVDRAAMNTALLAALRPGGRLVVVDHHAEPGSGVEVGETLHRIDEALLRRELETAGFRFDAAADFMRNPQDPRDKPFFEMDQPTDAFVHRYLKPE